MEKTFKIEWETEDECQRSDMEKFRLFMKSMAIHSNLKVTEIIPEQSNRDALDLESGQSIKPEPKKDYCKCPGYLSVGTCCDVCHKAFKPEPATDYCDCQEPDPEFARDNDKRGYMFCNNCHKEIRLYFKETDINKPEPVIDYCECDRTDGYSVTGKMENGKCILVTCNICIKTVRKEAVE